MSEHLPDSSVPDTTPIRRLIARTRRLLRSSWVVTGLGITVGFLLGTLVTGTLLDLVVPLGEGARLAVLVVILSLAGAALVWGVVRPLCRRLRPHAVARRIEAHIPGIHNRLVSCLDLSGKQRQPAVSQAFYRRLLREALERIRTFRPWAVVNFLRLRRSALFALSSTLAFVLALFLFSDRLPTALARIFNPLADIPPASGVAFTVEPGDADRDKGDDIVFHARVTKGSPERLELVMTGAENKTLRYDLQKGKGDVWACKVSGKLPEGFGRQFTYRVYGGRTWSRLHTITLRERPRITGLETVLHYPDYMGLPARKTAHHNLAQPTEVAGPEGGGLEVVVKAQGDADRGEILLKELDWQPAKQRPERVWFEGSLPAGAREGVVWTWKHEPLQGRSHAHTGAGGAGERTHWFEGAAPGLPVKAGESLFAWVYLPADQRPEAIMLQWHDGTGWEHRAYWGADRFRQGQPDTASRRYLGPLPPAGRWVRLEVPARVVDLEDRTLHGMSFTVYGGQCWWQAAGTLPPATVLVPVVRRRFPMKPLAAGSWSGRLPLRGEGLYQVVLRNALNKTDRTKDAKFRALPDQPPEIELAYPQNDLTLGKPQKVMLELRATDDYGLKEIALYVKRGEQGAWSRQVIRSYPKPQRDDNNLISTLDLLALKVVLGDTLTVKVEAVDRKGQTAVTPERKIRLIASPSAADKQLAEFEKSQDPLEQKLAQLLAAQAKINQAMEKVATQYAPLMEKVQEARAEARTRLDPASAKLLEAMRGKLGELAQAKEKTKELGLKTDPKAPAPLDPQSAQVLNEARQKLTDLARERERNAALDAHLPPPPPNQPPKLDADSENLLQNLQDQLTDLARHKAALAKAGKPLPATSKPTQPDAQGAKLVKRMEKKLNELNDEREKNALANGAKSAKDVQLDAKSLAELTKLQNELANLSGQQGQNANQGQQVSGDMARAIDQAKKLQLLPQDVTGQMEATRQLFDQKAVQAMKDLQDALARAARANKGQPPDGEDLKAMQKQGERLKQDLEAIKKRLQALAEARKRLLSDPNALANLRNELLQQNGTLTARDLQELRDYLARLQAELKKQKGRQEQLKDRTAKADPQDLEGLKKKQSEMDWDLFDLFGKTRKLKEAGRRLAKKQHGPKMPYTPDADEETVPPKEEDTDEPLPTKKGDKSQVGKKNSAGDKTKKGDEDDEDESKRSLPLNGKRQKTDPRYAKKKVPLSKKHKGAQADDSDDERDDLQAHQDENLNDINEEEKGLDNEARAVDSVLEQLKQALRASQRGQQHSGQPHSPQANPSAQDLAALMQSPEVQRALAMAAQLRQMQARSNQGQPTPNQGQPAMTASNPNSAVQVDLSKVDPATRAVILKLQPKVREEVSRGMQDSGPEGYQKYIQEYYKRLIRMQNSK